MEQSARPSSRRIILAGLVGNVMEWYDFAVYGYLAIVIGKLFFPSEDPSVSVIAAFGAFAAGFMMRPIGGLLIGRIGDLIGRRRALLLSVFFMAVPTVLIACLPTYETIGVMAPILLILLRMVQGLSVGGEYTSSLIFLAEHAPSGRRARTAIWGNWGSTAGVLLGSGVGSVVAYIFTDAQVLAWAWRLPFFLGIFVAITAILIRRALLAEAPRTEQLPNPIVATFTTYIRDVARVALLNVGLGVGFYAAFVYSVTYIKEIDNLPSGVAFNLNTEAMVVLLLIMPIAAYIADRIGRKPLLIAGAAMIALGAVPFFELMHHTDPLIVFLGELGFVFGVGIMAGGSVANVELIPAPVRCTGLAFAYNSAVGIFGGTTPLIAAWLIAQTGNPIAPAYWVAAGGLVSLLTAIFLIRETRFDKLDTGAASPSAQG